MAPKTPIELGRKMAILEAELDFSVNDHVTEAVDLGEYGLIGLIVPPLLSANGDIGLHFEVSSSGREGTFVRLYNYDGTLYDVNVITGDIAISTDDLAPLAAYRYVKIEVDGPQIGDLTFTFVLKG